jgi:hypothetical protein
MPRARKLRRAAQPLRKPCGQCGQGICAGQLFFTARPNKKQWIPLHEHCGSHYFQKKVVPAPRPVGSRKPKKADPNAKMIGRHECPTCNRQINWPFLYCAEHRQALLNNENEHK